MTNWLQKVSDFFIGLIKAIFTALLDFIHDAVVWVLDQVLTALSTLITAIPVPDFLTSGHDIGTLLQPLPAYALYCINHLQLATALGILGGGFAFRLLRKLVTLGQW